MKKDKKPGSIARGKEHLCFLALAGMSLIVAAAVWMAVYFILLEKECREYRRIAEISGHPDRIAESVAESAVRELSLGAWEKESHGVGGKRREQSYDWDALEAVNKDVAGWLCLPGLADFPVVGTQDNGFYLSHDFAGNRSSLGCPFMDRDTREEDFNRVIYGHNMGTGSDAMFSALIRYGDRDYFNENRALFYTDRYEEVTAYEILAVVEYNTSDVGEWDFRVRNHESRKEGLAWMERLKERALFYREPDGFPERLITLTTCDRRFYGKDGRFLVIAGK